MFPLFNYCQKPDPQTDLEGRSLWAGRERKDGVLSHCGFGFFLSLQNNISSALVSEVSETNDIEDPQDTVTEEAIGSPLAMWEVEIQNIELEKGEGGLGFSILDYQVGLLPFKICERKQVFVSFRINPLFHCFLTCNTMEITR